jgi:hypothetical protein
MCDILSREDYINFSAQIEAPDATNLVDFILDMLRNHRVTDQNTVTVNIARRARRFMFKVISKTPVIPPSLVVTGVSVPAEGDYIGGGGFGRVFKGELRGSIVALKVLYKSDNDVVSSLCPRNIVANFSFNRPSVEKH